MKSYPYIVTGLLALAASSMAAAQTSDQELQASQLLDADVLNSRNEQIGAVDDLLIGRDGRVTQVILSVGGILGIGEKQVAVRYDELQVVAEDPSDPDDNDINLIYATTKAALEALPAVRYDVED